MSNIAIVSVGCLLLVLAVLIYFVPIASDGHTAFQDDEICSSGGANQMALTFGLKDVMQACQFAKLMTFVTYGFGIIGVVLVGVGAVVSSKPYKEDESSLDILKDRYASGEITKEEFDKMKKDLE